MAKLILKATYAQNKNAAGYMEYIATREGVELLDENTYMKYMATRPRSHGLFSSGEAVDLDKALTELSRYDGRVWTMIFSLRRDDATRLSYDKAESWKQILIGNQNKIAQALNIPQDDLRWYAAFHDEGSHPHVHMMLWSVGQSQGYLTNEGIESIRSKLTNEIFKDELTSIYVQKDLKYRAVRDSAQDKMRELIVKMQSASCDTPEIEKLMVELSENLKSLGGKKQYGYLPKQMKELVDSIVDELAKQPEVARFYAEWNKLRDDIQSYYKQSQREHLPLSQQKEFKAIKNIIIREAENLRMEQPENKAAEYVLKNPPDSKNTLGKEEEALAQGSDDVETYTPSVLSCATRLLHHLSQVFKENAIAPTNPLGIRIDSKRRKLLQAKRMAMGHKPDDHEQVLQGSFM